MENKILIHNENDLRSKIYNIRGVQVMLDRDLSEIYGYTVKAFNQQVKNNIEKFDEDFRFQLTKDEFDEWNLKSNFLTSSFEEYKTEPSNWGGVRKLPFYRIFKCHKK